MHFISKLLVLIHRSEKSAQQLKSSKVKSPGSKRLQRKNREDNDFSQGVLQAAAQQKKRKQPPRKKKK